MGCHGGWAEMSCILPNGLLPDRETCVGRAIDSERWSEAEERVAELISHLQPNEGSGKRRKDIADYIQSLIVKCLSCQVYILGSVPLMTYLPDGDIDLTVFSNNENLKDAWTDVYRVMKEDVKNENAEFHVKEVQLIAAEVKVVKCLVEGIVVDITFHQAGGLRSLCFLEEMDHLINQDHLFKRSIILIKAWCYYESRILGAHYGLLSTYALETMIIYIFHVFDNSFTGPLEVLYRFLEFFSNFDWENFCISIWGPVPVRLLPEIAVMPPRKNNGKFYHKKFFLESSSTFIDSLACGQHCQRRSFVSKHFNIVDPLCVHNNLGRSVYKGNFYRVCSAFVFGAEKLAMLFDLPKEEMIFKLSQFFMNTWERHRAGLHTSSTTTRMEYLKPSKSIQVGESYTARSISYKEQNENISEDPADEHLAAHVGLFFYGASSQIHRIINQNSRDISWHNGIRTVVCNAKNKEDYSSGIIRNQNYVEKAFDSVKPVRNNNNHENLSSNYSNKIKEKDCRLQGQHSMFCSEKECFRSHSSNVSKISSGESVVVQKSDSNDSFLVSLEQDSRSKSLAAKIMSRQAVKSIDDPSCSKQSLSLQATVSVGDPHSTDDSATFTTTVETSFSEMHSQHSYNDYLAQENYRTPPKAGDSEVPVKETGRMSDEDFVIATGRVVPSNSEQMAIVNPGVVPSALYPTGPPMPFLEMLQTYNSPSHRSYYDGLYGLFDDETLYFDRNVDSGGTFDQQDIHVTAPSQPNLSHGLPSSTISLLGPSSYPYSTVVPNMYFQKIFQPTGPVSSIPLQGSQFVPATRVLPRAQMITSDILTFGDGIAKHTGGIKTYLSTPRVVLRDQSPTPIHSRNYNHCGGNLDNRQQNCVNGSPQLFWFTNEPYHCEKPGTLPGCLIPNYSQTAGSFDLCRRKEITSCLMDNNSIGSSSSSQFSTYMTQGMDLSLLLAARSSSSKHQRMMAQKNNQLKEGGFPSL